MKFEMATVHPLSRVNWTLPQPHEGVSSCKFKVVSKSSQLAPSYRRVREENQLTCCLRALLHSMTTGWGEWESIPPLSTAELLMKFGLMKMNFSLHQNATTHELSSDRYAKRSEAPHFESRFATLWGCKKSTTTSTERTFSFTYHVIETHKSNKFSFDQNWKLLLYRSELKWALKIARESTELLRSENVWMRSFEPHRKQTTYTRRYIYGECEIRNRVRSRPKIENNLRMLLDIDPKEERTHRRCCYFTRVIKLSHTIRLPAPYISHISQSHLASSSGWVNCCAKCVCSLYTYEEKLWKKNGNWIMNVSLSASWGLRSGAKVDDDGAYTREW